ncbi:MAG: hypothetical protein PVJ19_03085 [Desulfobacteraceae bacterium]|jgi:hypothetical protein
MSNTIADGYKSGVESPTSSAMSDSAYAEQYQVAQDAITEAAKPIAMAISNVQSSACKKFTENAKKVAKQACDELKEE